MMQLANTKKTEEELSQEQIRELYKRYPVDPDKELKLWEEWITIRQEETENLGRRVTKPPVDLTMNLLEKYRADIERKRMLEYAQLEEKPLVRGDPWEQPYRLPQGCYCKPVYEMVRTAKDLGKPKVIEHIGVPQHIQVTEKGLTGEPQRKEYKKLDAEYVKYRELREKKYEKKIKKVNPFTPDIDALLIIGSKPKAPPPPPPEVPEIKITPPESQPKDALCGVYCLRVNNSIFLKDIPNQGVPHLEAMLTQNWIEGCQSWTYYFNIPVGKVGRSKLRLENLGTITLRYCWKKIKRPIPYIPEEPTEQVFFFNKNEDVLSPGQYKELNLTFVANKPGIYKEFWELSTCNIFFFDALGTKIILNLYADSVEKVQKRSMLLDLLIQKIDRRTSYKLMRDIINDLLEIATVTKPLLYPYKHLFLEAELFVMRNPVCYYHQSDVQQLKEKFTEMGGKNWDLSIRAWRKLMISKEFDDRMACYDFLKIIHSDLLKPLYPTDSLLKEKYRAVKLILGQLMDSFYDVYVHLSEINGINERSNSKVPEVHSISTRINPLTEYIIENTFYLHMYKHVANALKLCAGALSSIDLDRWIEFDFCQW